MPVHAPCTDDGTVPIIGTYYLHPNLKKKIKKLYITFFEELFEQKIFSGLTKISKLK